MKARFVIEGSHDDRFVVDVETGATLSYEELVAKLNEQELALELLSALETTNAERIKELESGLSFALYTIDNIEIELDEGDVEMGEEEIEWVRELIGQKRNAGRDEI